MADLSGWIPIASIVGFIAFVLFIALPIVLKKFYIKVEQGTALIINTLRAKPRVTFTGGMVLPIIHMKELMKISLITLEVDRRGKDGLICKDNMRADITVAFYLRVNETEQDVLRVAKAVGTQRASDNQAVYTLFAAKFSEALKTVGKKVDFEELFEDRQRFRDAIVEAIGRDLNGYSLEDVAIDYLEQTPKSALDPNNILDSQGIKKITELTAKQNIQTNIFEKDEELAITKKNVEAREAMLELERQQADAEAKQAREVASVIAREEAETLKIQEEERLKSETASIEVVRDLAIQSENQQREIEIANENRQRAVAIETEKVERTKRMERVHSDREVELTRIEADKEVEREKKNIADIIRERVAVDKTVAIEEEKINEVREVSEADRLKQIQVKGAEAVAEEQKVKEVKAAEAAEIAAKHKATEVTTLAEANLEAAEKDAAAKIKLAEATKAQQAAAGLAEAEVIRAMGQSEAEVIRQKGESEADAELKVGSSKADVTLRQFRAEAEGLTEKFEAMNSMSPDARSHEEFRMTLETALKETLASIEAGKLISKENAEVLATALREAKIDIVGGEEHFFDTFAKSLSMGKAIDGLANKSETIQGLLGQLSHFIPTKDDSKSAS
ncbi:hypothetical protein [Arenicella xantha]|uniref:Putative membrane protein YqiK n=1 Tax=Arenicella xantha TaxID=644221 RepID=A0A395JN42_9GAMM|nr:hypothetical protein [Arenicella xantha]RBP51014.1 putative membrane protein YqiK [Arenicella xantha]